MLMEQLYLDLALVLGVAIVVIVILVFALRPVVRWDGDDENGVN